MRRATSAIGLALCLFTAMHLSALSARPAPTKDEQYDLRGPAPERGEITVSKTTFKIKDADVQISVGGKKMESKESMVEYDEEEVKVLAVEGRQATKVQTTVVKEYSEATEGEETQKKTGELQGEVIISERTKDGKWKHSLVDTRPSEKQKKDLDKRIGPENEDELYPAGMTKIGHEWTVDATALQRMFGGSITDLKGKLKMKFAKVEEVNGELCAVIESAGKISGTAQEDEGTLKVELDMKGTTWRSVKTGLDLKDKASGTIKMSGPIEIDGVKVDFELEGPFTIDGTSKFKVAKD